MTILYVLLAIVLLGVLIMVHEAGHFAAARLCGIAVKEFSIGFGPKLLQRKSKKSDTLFSLRPIPLGGYCMFYGDTDDDPTGEKKNDPRNYSNAAVWKRMISVVAGPLMNLLLAFVVAVVLVACYGYAPTTPYIVSVDEGMPAQQAGLRENDVFVSIAGQSMTDLSTDAVSNAIRNADTTQPIEIVVSREGGNFSCDVQPVYDEASERYMIGITFQQGYRRIKTGEVLPQAWSTCVEASGAILNALGKLVTTGEGLNDTAGPVGVVQMVAEQTRQGGVEIFLLLAVVISINLGLVNLLPIPALDGSRLVFMILEAIRRKPVSQRVEAIVHMCGYIFLFGVMIFFTFKDVIRIIH